MFSFIFFFNSIFLGVGLAMDAFSVSLANGLNEPKMKKGKLLGVAATFAFFQFAMPMIGWICVHSIMQYFSAVQKFIPWIALILLALVGSNMLVEGMRCNCEDEKKPAVGVGALLIQGIATSIDALSVGFTIADYNLPMALVCCLLIAVVTFFICIGGLILGKKFGTKFSDKASVFGGLILIFIGLEIFITGII